MMRFRREGGIFVDEEIQFNAAMTGVLLELSSILNVQDGIFVVNGIGHDTVDIADTGDTTLILKATTANEDTYVRWTENTNWFGGYIRYDGGGNRFEIGTHATDDVLPSNDTVAISMPRDTATVRFDQYGGGTVTGTEAYFLTLNTSGDVLETSVANSRNVLDLDHLAEDVPGVQYWRHQNWTIDTG